MENDCYSQAGLSSAAAKRIADLKMFTSIVAKCREADAAKMAAPRRTESFVSGRTVGTPETKPR